MKFAICNETFQDWPLEKAFDFAADCGYTGVEIAPFTLADKRDGNIRPARVLKSAAWPIGPVWRSSACTGCWPRPRVCTLPAPTPQVRRKTADYLADLARLCCDLGGQLMVFGSPKQRCLLPGVTRESAMDYAAEVFQRILPVLEETDVVIALEPLGPEETDFLQ